MTLSGVNPRIGLFDPPVGDLPVNQVYSTRAMAQMCGVNESTIKRWADSGKLLCMKTPGGHRKFRIQDVVSFLNAYGFESVGLTQAPGRSEPDSNLAVRILKRDWPGLSAACIDVALRRGPKALSDFILRMPTTGYSFVEICDQVLGLALEEVGNRWSDGRLGILEEHLVSSALVHALGRLAEVVPRHEFTGRRGLCCPIEEERHDIGVRMTGLLLDTLGWETRVATSATPLGEIALFLRSEKPDMLCLSIVSVPLGPGCAGSYRRLWDVSRETGTKVALGGRGSTAAGELPHDFLGGSLRELEGYVRKLGSRRRGNRGKTGVRPRQ